MKSKAFLTTALAFAAITMSTGMAFAQPEVANETKSAATEEIKAKAPAESPVFTATESKVYTAAAVVAPSLSQIKDAPTSFADLGPFVEALIFGVTNSQWLIVAALLVLLIIFVLRKFWLSANTGKAWAPLVATGLGLLVGPCVAILGGANQAAAILTLFSGPVAMVFWSGAFKYFLAKYLPKLKAA